jgi:hypothetical protein
MTNLHDSLEKDTLPFQDILFLGLYDLIAAGDFKNKIKLTSSGSKNSYWMSVGCIYSVYYKSLLLNQKSQGKTERGGTLQIFFKPKALIRPCSQSPLFLVWEKIVIRGPRLIVHGE